MLAQPYLPSLSAKLQDQIKTPTMLNMIPEQFHMMLPPWHKIGEPSPLVKLVRERVVI